MLGFWLYAVGAAFWAPCALAYGLRSPWYRSSIGRALFTGWAALASVLVLAAVFRIIPLPHAVAVVLGVTVLSAVDVAGCVQLILVLRLQRSSPPDRPHPEES